MRKKISAIILFSLVLINSLFSQSAGEENNYLRWNNIEGASYYILEVRKEDKEVFRTETQENYVQLFLIPGEYLYKISVFNKFRKSMAESEWRTLIIEESAMPFISSFAPEIFYLDNNPVVIRIEAFNIIDNAVISLIDSSGTIINGKLSLLEDNNYEAEFQPETLEYGNYNLSLKNPSGLSYTSSGSLLLREPVEPEIKSVDRQTISAGLIYNISMEGNNFEEGITIELRSSNDLIKPSSIIFESEKRILFMLDLSDAVPGQYKLSAENPSGLSDIYSRNIVVTELVDQEASVVKKDLFTIHGGYLYGYAVSNLPDYHNYNYWGYTGRLQLDFNNDFFNKFIWLSPLGVEFELDYYPKDINFYEIGMNIYYKSRFQTPFNFIIRGGGGLSIFEDMDNAPDTGRYLQGTAGLAVRLLKFLYFDFSTGPKIWIVEREYYNYIISSASFGYTF